MMKLHNYVSCRTHLDPEPNDITIKNLAVGISMDKTNLSG